MHLSRKRVALPKYGVLNHMPIGAGATLDK